MIQRINFIERAPFQLTYRKFVWLGAVLVGLFLLFYGIQFVRVAWLERRVIGLTSVVTELKGQREKRLREVATESGESGESGNVQEALLKELGSGVTWSGLLRELTSSVAPSLWLTSIKSYEKGDSPSKRALLLNGQAEEAGSVTIFLKSLEESPRFENVVLTSSKQENGVASRRLYQFSIDLVVSRASSGGLL